jgi:hypothetical protein
MAVSQTCEKTSWFPGEQCLDYDATSPYFAGSTVLTTGGLDFLFPPSE